MATTLSFSRHGAGIGDAAAVVRANAVSSGLDAAVATCPGWTVLDLVLHLGAAHRWAVAVLDGRPQEQWPTEASVRAEGLAAGDVLDWFDDGMVHLLQVLADAPADLQAFFFLKDAPRPREAWARRQCHETTIHAVDAMAARLGSAPTAAQTWIHPELAADGVDELLTGFVPCRTGRLRIVAEEPPLTVLVRATDVDRAWTLRISDQPVVTTAGTGEDGPTGGIPDALWEGTAVGLYLALWNRGDELAETGPRPFLERWRRDQRIEWS